ncbi:MAG: hypothetical protein RL661_899 [Pseudomonadota bacterium]|jgi:hypothetical protein
MKCSECRYWVREDGLEHLGECRMNPPTVVHLTCRDDADEPGIDPMDSENVMFHSIWPITTDVSWCGRFIGLGKAN